MQDFLHSFSIVLHSKTINKGFGKIIDILLDGKGIRLDVYVNDEQGTVYSVEMQCGRKRELPKRTRFYQGNIDLDLLFSGESYTKLKKHISSSSARLALFPIDGTFTPLKAGAWKT